MSRTLVIGDVHGCVHELDDLLSRAALTSDDRVVLAGDLVAKGPYSREVVQRAAELPARAVLGNHDAAVLRWRRTPAAERAALRMKDEHRRAAESLTEAEWRYLEALPLYLRLPELQVVVLHGGLMPGVPLESQRPEDLLNLRSIRPDGAGSKRVDEGVPWASLWPGPELVVFGHDARRRLQRHPHAYGLDTGCVYGGELTGLLLPERRLVQVPARTTYQRVGD